jgi:hypothetical protein
MTKSLSITGEILMHFLLIAKHSPESCPMHNEAAKKTFTDFSANLDALCQKYGINIVGAWASMPEHMTIMVLDVPNPDAMLKFMREPPAMAWQGYQTITARPVLALEEAMKFLK